MHFAPNAVAEGKESIVRTGSNSVKVNMTLIRSAYTPHHIDVREGDEVTLTITNVETIRLCRRYDKLVMPGAFTPTEIVTAWEAGADVVKVFPSEVLGPAYLKAIRGPLPQIKLMPTGGIDVTNAADYLKAGAVALGVGGNLVDPKLVAAGDFAKITQLARQYVEIVKKHRG